MVDPRSRAGDPVDSLLAALVLAIAPPALDPPPASIAALRASAAERSRSLADPVMTSPASAWRRKLPLAGAMAGILAFGGATVALAKPGLPPAVRSVARVVGIPVDSQPVAEVRSDRGELQRALDRNDATRARRALEDLHLDWARLDPAERNLLAPDAAELEREGVAGSYGSPSSPQPEAPVTTTEPETPDDRPTGTPPPESVEPTGTVDAGTETHVQAQPTASPESEQNLSPPQSSPPPETAPPETAPPETTQPETTQAVGAQSVSSPTTSTSTTTTPDAPDPSSGD